ncbi:MAG TPA: YbhB/YbcL family Raf kinase inhibitor-like protein [Candidatus Binataceae bacterium]|jgi:hypothetical protein
MKAYVKAISVSTVLALLALPRSTGAQTTLAITSTAFTAGASIPVGYSCKSPKVESPPLAWKGVPADAKTLVLIVKDPDAPKGTFIHWVVYNLPASLSGLEAGVPLSGTLANGARQGANSLGRVGYLGPCPPPGSAPHHYHFELSALDTALDLKPGATANEVESATKGHVKATGELVGTFAR